MIKFLALVCLISASFALDWTGIWYVLNVDSDHACLYPEPFTTVIMKQFTLSTIEFTRSYVFIGPSHNISVGPLNDVLGWTYNCVTNCTYYQNSTGYNWTGTVTSDNSYQLEWTDGDTDCKIELVRAAEY